MGYKNTMDRVGMSCSKNVEPWCRGRELVAGGRGYQLVKMNRMHVECT